VILPSAGYATRLYPLTENKPKALLQVGNKKIIESVINKLLELEIDEIIIVSNSKFYPNFLDWRRNFQCNIPIKIIDDGTFSSETRLGWVGDVNFAVKRENIEDDCLFVSSDNLFTFSIKEMADKFKATGKDLIALYDVKNFEWARQLGVVSIDETDKVTGFVEKPSNPESTLCSIGIYFYSKDTIKLFDEYLNLGNNPDRPGDFLEWLINKKEVFSRTFDSDIVKWHDIGNLDQLKEAEGIYGE